MMDEIEIEEFSKIDLRVGRINKASYIEGADRLLKLLVDLGEEQREILAGIRTAYEPKELQGKFIVVVANLKSRKMRFGVSQGMILAAGPGGKNIFLLSPDSGAVPGMKIS
tara:strand:+ start:176 stop:508 length:333 start_codon:yes stop_codon:yes gene_type:complete